MAVISITAFFSFTRRCRERKMSNPLLAGGCSAYRVRLPVFAPHVRTARLCISVQTRTPFHIMWIPYSIRSSYTAGTYIITRTQIFIK